MNDATLAAGQRLDAELAAVETAVRAAVVDVLETWPGRRNEALIYSDRVLEALQEARTDLGVLIGVLAQDVAP